MGKRYIKVDDCLKTLISLRCLITTNEIQIVPVDVRRYHYHTPLIDVLVWAVRTRKAGLGKREVFDSLDLQQKYIVGLRMQVREYYELPDEESDPSRFAQLYAGRRVAF